MAENPDTPSSADPCASVNALAHHLRRAFHERRWREMGEFLAFDRLWAFDAPLDLEGAFSWADERLADVRDVEVSLVRILRTDSSENTPSGSYTCCLLWIEEDTWEQHEVEFDLHIGFARDEGGRWRLAHLGLTPPTPEEMPELDEGATHAFLPAVSSGADGLGIFAGPANGSGDGQVLIYVPVRVPPAAVRGILERERPKSRT